MKRISRLTGLAVAGVLGLSSLATAQTGPSLITQPFEEGSKVEVTFNGQWQGKADAQNGTTDDEIQLQIYDEVPGLEPSDQYSCRVKLGGKLRGTSEWKSVFAFMNRSKPEAKGAKKTAR